MEEMRYFGYICPQCGKPVMAGRSTFVLSAAAVRIECPSCGKAEMDIETDGTRYRLSVPCGLCGKTHTAECTADAVLRGRGIGLACPETKQICCYAGEEDQVRRSMEELAKLHNIRPVLCSVPPTDHFIWRKDLKPAKNVIKLNEMIRNYADSQGIPYIDYHAVLSDENGALPAKYSKDGVHPVLAGYKVMERLLLERFKEIDR